MNGNNRSDLIEWMFEGYKIKKLQNSSFWDSDITWTWNYSGESGGIMAYGLLTPSNADDFEALPLIVYFHGLGAANDSRLLKSDGIAGMLQDDRWSNTGLEGFSAYVLCPHLTNFNPQMQWANTWTPGKVSRLLDYFISQHNVDTNNIVMVGFSLGSSPAWDLQKSMSNYFSKSVICSGFDSHGSKPSLPTLWYVGSGDLKDYIDAGHAAEKVLGEENVCWLNTGHGTVGSAMTQDDGSFVGTGRK